jgi:acetyl esterase/lipase
VVEDHHCAAGLSFSAADLAEARRFNRMLMYAPRFRAPNPPGRAFIQAMIEATMHTRHAFRLHGVPGLRIETRTVTTSWGPTALRILRHGSGEAGVYLDYHGGGWCIGTASMDDPVNGRIARDCNLTVVSVDYELMPRRRLADVIAQCQAAADWVADNALSLGAGDAIVIGGESAGAHLAAMAGLHLRRREDFSRVKGLVLFYGAFDLGGTDSARNAPDHALVLHGPSLRRGGEALLPGLSEAERRDPSLSPAWCELSGMPPALMLCGTLDPLVDDTRLMAERWRAAGGEAELVLVPEAPHAFNRFNTRMATRTNAFVRNWINERVVSAASNASSLMETRTRSTKDDRAEAVAAPRRSGSQL